MLLNFRSKVCNANIRGCELKENKQGEGYLLVNFEDEKGEPYQLVDKDLDRQSIYKRNTDMDLTISITERKLNVKIGNKDTFVTSSTIRIVDAHVL